MAKIDALRNEIIEKVLCISDKNYLNAINRIVDNKEFKGNVVKLSEEQKLMLQSSELDIENKRLIKHSNLMKEKKVWLQGK